MDNLLLDRIRNNIADSVAKRKKLFVTDGDVNLVAVTKNHPIDVIEQSIKFGLTDIAENRVQEAKVKQEMLAAKWGGDYVHKVKWHLIGHLQTNKARLAVKLFDIIESVDSVHLLQILNDEAGKIDKVQEILLQINIAQEPQKTGFNIDGYHSALENMGDYRNLQLRGLMTIAPVCDDVENVRYVFKQEYDEFVRLQKRFSVDILSMGMTNDYMVAVEEGANEVRIGRALFGERDYAVKF